MSKTLVCVNVLDNVNSQVYGSHCQEWFRLGRNTSDEFILFHPNRLSIDNARTQAAKLAMQLECDFLYFIDDDMILSPNTYQSLKSASGDIVQALTFIRGYPFHCMAFKKVGTGVLDYFDDYAKFVNSEGLVEAEAVGFACCLINVNTTLKKIKPPYFVTGIQATEDVYFCCKVKDKLGDSVKIYVDTKRPTGHLLNPEVISAYNHDVLSKFHKPIREPDEDRGEEYLNQCKQTLEECRQDSMSDAAMEELKGI